MVGDFGFRMKRAAAATEAIIKTIYDHHLMMMNLACVRRQFPQAVPSSFRDHHAGPWYGSFGFLWLRECHAHDQTAKRNPMRDPSGKASCMTLK